MKNNKLVDEMYYSFSTFDYKRAYELVNEYLSNKENGIYNRILYIVIECEISFRMFDKAVEHLRVMQEWFPDYYVDHKMVERYIRCGRVDLAKEFMEGKAFSDKGIFFIAQTYFLEGYYDEAKKVFGKLLSMNIDDDLKRKVIKTLSSIELHESDGLDLTCSYNKFVKDEKTLETGHIVYINRFLEDKGMTMLRPYMIWKIEGDIVYAFPVYELDNNRRKDIHSIHYQDYIFSDFDRCVLPPMVSFEKDNIEKVVDKLDEKDIVFSLGKIYEKLCNSQDGSSRKFFQEYNKNINFEVGDVIYYHDKPTGAHLYYYVVGENYENNNLEVVELTKNGYKYDVVNGDVFELLRDDYLIKVVITTPQRIYLNKQFEKGLVLEKYSEKVNK